MKQLYIAGAIVAIVFTGGFLLFRAGKKTGESVPPVLTVPEDTGGATLSATEIHSLAVSMKNDMTGVNVTHDQTIYNTVNNLSNHDLSEVNNDFNVSYFKSSGYSLVVWLDSEWNKPSIMYAVLNRLKALGAL